MASRQYISIIRLFHHLDIPTNEGFNPARVKKQLQAEFGISKDGFIEVDGFTYSRHQVFEELENPGFKDHLRFHQQIWESPQLLQLLESNNADTSSLRAETVFFRNEADFPEFISPFLAGPFSHLSRRLLLEHRFTEVSELLYMEHYLLPAERETAFGPLRLFLDENRRILRNVNSSNYKLMHEQILHWIEGYWGTFLNAVPDDLYEERTDTVVRLVDLTVAIQKTRKKDCVRISSQLLLVTNVPDELRQIIISNDKIYAEATTGSKNLWIIWVAVFIGIRVATSSDGCNRDSNKVNFERLKEIQVHYADSSDLEIRADSFSLDPGQLRLRQQKGKADTTSRIEIPPL